jgi:hypothetical protein
MQYIRRGLLFALLLLLIPFTAFADGVTAVLGFQILHVTIGNLVIGLIETLYLRARFKLKANAFIIILGNYVSMCSGFLIASSMTNYFGFGGSFSGNTSNIKEYHMAIIIGICIVFLVTLIIELPFYKWAIKSISWKTAMIKEIEPNILTTILVLAAYYFL